MRRKPRDLNRQIRQIRQVMGLARRLGLRKKSGIALVAFVVLLYIAVQEFFFTGEHGSGEYYVLDVIDGDTVILQGVDSHLRYIGIDTPETIKNDSAGDPLSREAKELNKDLVGGKRIRVEFDEEKYDAYGRMLGYIFIDGVFVNEEIVRRGLARTLFLKKNRKYAPEILEAEEDAKRNKRGIWGNLSSLESPQGNSRFIIKPRDAHRFIRDRVVVRGKLTDYKISKKVLVLKFGNDLDVTIFKSAWENFKFFRINPETYYLGKPIEVIGRIKTYKGQPQIIIDHPIQIRVLE